MLYTRKGDSGTTKAFDTKPGERISKSSARTESLGALDELNSFLGLAKVKVADSSWSVNGKKPAEILHWIQNGLFIVQAEVAGSDKKVSDDRIAEMEAFVDTIEKELPPIKTFFISGGTEVAALFDISRTLARKAERRLVRALEEESISVGAPTLAFMNRLSSLLYALARFSNFTSGVDEKAPWYN